MQALKRRGGARWRTARGPSWGGLSVGRPRTEARSGQRHDLGGDRHPAFPRCGCRGSVASSVHVGARGQHEAGHDGELSRSTQPLTAPINSPNSCQRSPLKRPIWTCLTGAKSVGLVLILIPGSSIGTVKSCRLAACFMTFSRVSWSPHIFSTCTVVAATEGP